MAFVVVDHASIRGDDCHMIPQLQLQPMERFLFNVVTSLAPPVIQIRWLPRAFSWHVPVSFDAVLQPWRPMPGDARLYNLMREKAALTCGLPIGKIPVRVRQLTIVQRTRYNRAWADVSGLVKVLSPWAVRWQFSIRIATLGHLRPCEKVRAISDASIVLVVCGSEATLSVFQPEGAALVVLEVFSVLHHGGGAEGVRGPGMTLGGSVSARASTEFSPTPIGCSNGLNATSPTNCADDGQGPASSQTLLSSWGNEAEVANARNLLYVAMAAPRVLMPGFRA